MSVQLKYVVDELNKEPFKRNYNLIRLAIHSLGQQKEGVAISKGNM